MDDATTRKLSLTDLFVINFALLLSFLVFIGFSNHKLSPPTGQSTSQVQAADLLDELSTGGAVSTAQITRGSTFTYQVSVTNHSSYPASDVSSIVPLLADLEFVGTTGSRCSVNGDLNCYLGPFNAETTQNLSHQFKVKESAACDTTLLLQAYSSSGASGAVFSSQPVPLSIVCF